MNHKEYRKILGKKVKEMTAEERREYNRLSYVNSKRTPMMAEYRRKRRAAGKDVNAWQQDPFNRAASSHNNKMRSRYPQARDSVLSTKELTAWLRDSDKTCYLCGTETLGIDHVVPLASGGSHTLSNMEICCVSCNSIKNNSTLDELLERLPSMRASLRQTIEELTAKLDTLESMETLIEVKRQNSFCELLGTSHSNESLL